MYQHVVVGDVFFCLMCDIFIRDNNCFTKFLTHLANIFINFLFILIERNPINAIRHKFAADIAREEREREEREREEKEERERKNREHFIKLKSKKVEKIEKGQKGRYKRPLDVDLLTPAHSEYWAEGVGEGGEKPWKFSCCCGETCSSYEHFRYHPLGRMFECSNCSIWSHVTCVLGNHISDDDLEELPVSDENYFSNAIILNIDFVRLHEIFSVHCLKSMYLVLGCPLRYLSKQSP